MTYMINRPAFGVRSTQTLVKIYNSHLKPPKKTFNVVVFTTTGIFVLCFRFIVCFIQHLSLSLSVCLSLSVSLFRFTCPTFVAVFSFWRTFSLLSKESNSTEVVLAITDITSKAMSYNQVKLCSQFYVF